VHRYTFAQVFCITINGETLVIADVRHLTIFMFTTFPSAIESVHQVTEIDHFSGLFSTCNCVAVRSAAKHTLTIPRI